MKFSPSLWLSAILPLTTAQIQYIEPQSSLTYSMSAVTTTTTDLHFNLSIPATHGWGAIGIGSMMTNALMFIILPDSTNGSTISLRTATGHIPPQPVTGMTLDVLSGSADNGVYMASAVCRACQTWSDGSLDVKSTSQDFVYAVGPGASGVSGMGQAAGISRHSYHGSFTIDMTKAAVSSVSDASNNSNSTTSNPSSGSSGNTGVSSSTPSLSEPPYNLVVAHASILALTFGLILPLGVIFVRVSSLGWIVHATTQGLGAILAIAGLGIAVHFSLISSYRDFMTAHQIIGLVAISVMVANVFLGVAHHAVFVKSGKRSAVTYVHLWAGRAVMLLGVINIVLGFLLLDNTAGAIGVGVVGLVIYFVAFGVATFLKRRNDKNARLGSVGDASSAQGTETHIVSEKPVNGTA